MTVTMMATSMTTTTTNEDHDNKNDDCSVGDENNILKILNHHNIDDNSDPKTLFCLELS